MLCDPAGREQALWLETGLKQSEVRWSTACTFLDYDRDGLLDIFIANFFEFDPAQTPGPGEAVYCMWKGMPVLCGPAGLPSGRNILYHNNGDGTFTDVSETSGIAKHRGNGLGAVSYDLDNDGWKDLFYVTGHVYPEVDQAGMGISYRQPRFLYRNQGNGRFQNISAESGPAFEERYSSRGCAFGDFNNDGKVNILIMNMNETPSLWRNETRNSNSSILVKLIGTRSNRSAIGARVRVVAGEHAQMDEVHSGDSLMSMSDLRLHFGLGPAEKVDLLEVQWPTSGLVERFHNLDVNQIFYIREGSGITRAERFAPPPAKN